VFCLGNVHYFERRVVSATTGWRVNLPAKKIRPNAANRLRVDSAGDPAIGGPHLLTIGAENRWSGLFGAIGAFAVGSLQRLPLN
jgi:hypothetical protein